MNAATQTNTPIGSKPCNSMPRKAKGKRKARTQVPRAEIALQALQNAVGHESTMNYEAIFEGFAEMGVEVDEILPRENVFTFNAWKAMGRVVRKGQHGVKVVTFVPMRQTDKETGEVTETRRPRSTTVFHISQTEVIDDLAKQK